MALTYHEPGIYLFMPAEEYHADGALGSSDLRELLNGARPFWLGSKLNPDHDLYRDSETKATIAGTALHDYLLGPLGDFHDKYVRRPDDRPGVSSGDKASLTKAAKKNLSPHQTLLHGDEWIFVETAGAVIKGHRDLGGLFEGADFEVSVFWIAGNGIRMKCRFDILKPRGIADIKSIANQMRRDLAVAAKMDIKYRRYFVQAAHYLEGRRQFPQLVKMERIFLCHNGERIRLDAKNKDAPPSAMPIVERLRKVAKTTEFAFQFVFVEKTRPLCWACTLSPENPIIQTGNDAIEKACQTYLHGMTEWGDHLAWPESWGLSELAIEEMPGGEWNW